MNKDRLIFLIKEYFPVNQERDEVLEFVESLYTPEEVLYQQIEQDELDEVFK